MKKILVVVVMLLSVLAISILVGCGTTKTVNIHDESKMITGELP